MKNQIFSCNLNYQTDKLDYQQKTRLSNKQAYLGIWDLRPKEQDSRAVAFQ